MFDFSQTNRLSPEDERRYEQAKLREERDQLNSMFMLSSEGKARLAELNSILGQ